MQGRGDRPFDIGQVRPRRAKEPVESEQLSVNEAFRRAQSREHMLCASRRFALRCSSSPKAEIISLGSLSCRRAFRKKSVPFVRDVSEFNEPRHLGSGAAFGNSLSVGTDQNLSFLVLLTG